MPVRCSMCRARTAPIARWSRRTWPNASRSTAVCASRPSISAASDTTTRMSRSPSERRRFTLRVEPLRHAQRVVAADRDERVEAEPADAVEDGAPARVILSWIGARGPEDRAALAEYRGDVARHEHARRGLAEEAGPAVPDPERLVPERGRAEDDGAD